MNTKYIILSITSIIMFQIMHAQKHKQDEIEKLKEILNITIPENFKVELNNNNNPFCTIDNLNQTLDLRDDHLIVTNTIKINVKNEAHTAHYKGPILWNHNFQIATNSDVKIK
ncbi:hypothetical protein [Formosa sp. PL04]|uniref:hypothetical protein n=1 Tax=Formosa sp. PL04 TaxID=3081755 RepID=UPI002980B556|nr:hypothetical protein [Formosa sp. PL04]MDW5290499.1 hypothetical protein [Formosa sp. PL04]